MSVCNTGFSCSLVHLLRCISPIALLSSGLSPSLHAGDVPSVPARESPPSPPEWWLLIVSWELLYPMQVFYLLDVFIKMSAHPTITVISWISDLSNCSSGVFFLCRLGELMNYSNLYAHFFSDSRAREHFLEPTRMHEWKECYLEINFVWSCCWALLELNGKGRVPNFMWLQRKIPKLACWGAPWLRSRCLDPNSMWVFWPWSAGLSTATEPAWKFLPSDLHQFIRMREVSVVSR